MADLQSILQDPNYVQANPETKLAIFEKHAPTDPNYANANPETQAAIRTKFGVGQPAKPVAGSQPLPSAMDRLSSMGGAALKGAVLGGPIGGMVAASGEGMKQFGEATDRAAHKAGEAVSQGLAPYVPGEVAGGAGYLTNVGVQAIPTILGAGIGKMAAPILENRGEALMRMALKPSTTLEPQEASRAVKTMLTAKLPGNWLPGENVTPGGIANIQTKLKDLGGQVDDILTKVTAQPNPPQVSQISVVNALNKPTQKFATQVTPEADLAAIKKVEDEFLRNYPSLIPIQQAHELKKGTYKVLGDKAFSGELKSADMEAQKALASGLRTEVEAGAPAIAPLNKEMSDLINAVKAAISRDAVASRKDPVGLAFLASHPVAAIAFMANRSEIIKSLLARAIYSGAGPAATGTGAAIGAVGGATSGKER